MEKMANFKKCSMCDHDWSSRDIFLDDKNIKLNGYQVDFEKLEYGLFYFTHTVPECGSTLAIYCSEFLDLYSGKKFKERRTGEEDCPGYCLDRDQLDRCEAQCECALVREVMHIIKEKKQ